MKRLLAIFIYLLISLFPDSAWAFNWALEMTQSPRAWLMAGNNKQITVAVIDTGIDERHPDLKDALWTNPNEIPNNKIDDDGNGYIDDIHGWNFAANNNQLQDQHGHGTHIAGIISAQGKSRPDIKGLAPKAKLMILKYYNPNANGVENLLATIRAINYAVQMGANIINYSGGGPEKNGMEESALRRAESQGVLIVAAAGNEKSNSDKNGFYPANYPLSNIVVVTAHDEENNLLPLSNYGQHSVHIAAPGKDILSTLPGSSFGIMTGTSQATAFVTGAAALLMSHNPWMTNPKKIASQLQKSGSYEKNLTGKTSSNKRINVLRALAMVDENQDAFGAELSHREFDDNSWLSDVSDQDKLN